MSFSKESEKEGALNYNKILKPRIALPLDNILDLDLNVLESNNNSKYIFLLSLYAYNNDSNSKSVLTLLTHNTNMLEEDLSNCITFAKDI